MAIIIEDKSICKICEKVMSNDEGLIVFPHFVENEKDIHYFFYDAVFHEKCFLNHALKDEVIKRLIEKGYNPNMID